MFKLQAIIPAGASMKKLIMIAVRGLSFSTNPRDMPPIAVLEHRIPSRRIGSGGTGRAAIVLACICLGLISVGGVISADLFLQFRALSVAMAETRREIAVTKITLGQIEKDVRRSQVETEAASVPLSSELRREQSALQLSPADVQIIRQAIRTIPPLPGAQSKIKVGDEISETGAWPIPEALVATLPKLQGRSFSIDRAGSIIFIGAGTKRVDAVIAYR